MTQIEKTVYALIYGISGLVIVMLIVLLFWLAGRQEKALFQIGDCVERTAKEQGFYGSYEERWKHFAEYCNDHDPLKA